MGSVQRIIITGDAIREGLYGFYAGFKQVDNFVDEEASMIALTGDPSMLGPHTIVLRGYVSGSVRYVEKTAEGIRLDDKMYDSHGFPLWSSSFQYPHTDANHIGRKLTAFLDTNNNLFPEGSLLDLLFPGSRVPASALDQAFFDGARKAMKQLGSAFYDGVAAMRGLGRGLTPAGDDFIAGMLYGMHCLACCGQGGLLPSKDRVYRTALGENLFSNQLLHMAREAQYFRGLKDFLSALLHPDNTDVRTPFRQLMAGGHTSGADLIAGYCFILRHRPFLFSAVEPDHRIRSA